MLDVNTNTEMLAEYAFRLNQISFGIAKLCRYLKGVLPKVTVKQYINWLSCCGFWLASAPFLVFQ
jgi:hypothetical protein